MTAVRLFRPTTQRSPRGGAVLAAVLIGLSIATLMLTAMAKSAHLAQQHLRLHAWQHQTEWLCEAGIARAKHAIRANDAYDGERWLIDASQLPSDFAASVEIRVDDKRVTVSAKYPLRHSSVISRTVTFTQDASST